MSPSSGYLSRINRVIERAARRLVDMPQTSILNIALEYGFHSAEVFSQTFKQDFGVTPSAWRQGDWKGLAEQRAEQLSKIFIKFCTRKIKRWRETIKKYITHSPTMASPESRKAIRTLIGVNLC